MKRIVTLALMLLLFSVAHAESVPAWQADPMEYNSCADVYRSSNFVLVGNSVYENETYFTNKDICDVLLRWEYDHPENVELLRDWGTSGFGRLFDRGDGLIFMDDKNGVRHVDYDGQNEVLLFTIPEKNSLKYNCAFLLLVGDRLYYEAKNDIWYYSFEDQKTHLLTDGTLAKEMSTLTMNAFYAYGKLYLVVKDYGLYAVDAFTGEVTTFRHIVPENICTSMVYEDWIYAWLYSDTLLRFDLNGENLTVFEGYDFFPERVHGDYVWIGNNTGFPEEAPGGFFRIPVEGFGDFSFVREGNEEYLHVLFMLGERMFSIAERRPLEYKLTDGKEHEFYIYEIVDPQAAALE